MLKRYFDCGTVKSSDKCRRFHKWELKEQQQVARTGWESQLKSKESEIFNKQELLYEKYKIYLWL